MTDLRTAAQQVMKAWDGGELKWFANCYQVMDALRAALQQPEQEPVATVKVMGSYNGVPALGCLIDASATNVKRGDKLYTHPPRREWRSLSEEEINDCWASHDPEVITRAVEAALRSKNHE